MYSNFNLPPYLQNQSAANLPLPSIPRWAYQSMDIQFLVNSMSYQNRRHYNIEPHASHAHMSQYQNQVSSTKPEEYKYTSNAGESQVVSELPSPSITDSGCDGSEILGPGATASSPSPHANLSTIKNTNDNISNKENTSSTSNNSNVQENPKLFRTKFTNFQLIKLEKEYRSSKYISAERRVELAKTLQLSKSKIRNWFQNRRAKEKMVLHMQRIRHLSYLAFASQPFIRGLTPTVPTYIGGIPR